MIYLFTSSLIKKMHNFFIEEVWNAVYMLLSTLWSYFELFVCSHFTHVFQN